MITKNFLLLCCERLGLNCAVTHYVTRKLAALMDRRHTSLQDGGRPACRGCLSVDNLFVGKLSLIPSVIIHRVVAHEDPPFRPNIPSMEMKPEYIELMVDCWDDDPEERPHIYRIVERLKKISGRGTNIIENMVTMMEKHANHSEQLIVDFLNDLYVSFDEIISRFDVYKVETVGDAYVVVSGCPKLNGLKHTSEIARMALELLSHMVVFRLRHLPDHQLQLRIGINTGPVVAAVVGVTMPRFFLYGHAVNIASKMESTSLPLRIHVSNETYSRLIEVGGFYMEERGKVQIKRQGLVTTYWLVGKEGFDKALPDPPLDASEPLFKRLDVYYAS
ncbi:atrial natriuretic peptide receptor 1-like [Oculina patagonica]